MTHKPERSRRFLAAFLILVAICTSTSVAFAQASLSSIVSDTTGAVASATIACNKNAIQSGIQSLFGGTATSSVTNNGATSAATNTQNVTSDVPPVSDNTAGTPSSSSAGSLAWSSPGSGNTPSIPNSGDNSTTTLTGDNQASITSDNPTGSATNTTSGTSSIVSSTGSTAQSIPVVLDSTTKKAIATSANAAQATNTKLNCTNAIEKAAAGVILREITLSTINWINHGFNGNPLYSKDTGSLLKGIGNQAVKDFNSIIGFDSKNYPFGKAVAQSLTNQIQNTFAQRAKYSLDQVIAQQTPGMNSSNFLNDFAVGGWNALLSQTLTNNNPIGFALSAQDALKQNTKGTAYSPAQDLKAQLQQSGGFLPIRNCVSPSTYNPNTSPALAAAAQNKINALTNGVNTNTNDAAAAQAVTDDTTLANTANANDAAAAQQNATAQANAAAADAADSQYPGPANDYAKAQADAAATAAAAALATADAQSAQANATLAQAQANLAAADQADANNNANPAIAAQQQVVVANTCAQWSTSTPGSVISHALNQKLDIPSNQLVNGQDLSTDITAIFNALENQLVNKGLSALSSASNSTNTNFTKNSTGIPGSNQNETVATDLDTGGSWASQGGNFNVFTDIPTVIRYEDNYIAPGSGRDIVFKQPGVPLASQDPLCNTPGTVFGAQGELCQNDPTLPEGYQQVLEKEILAAQALIPAIYQLDYCIPGPHPGWKTDAENTLQTFLNDPTKFPKSTAELNLILKTAAPVVSIVATIATGAIIGSAAGPWGTVIGAAVGAIVGAVITIIADSNLSDDRKNEKAFGEITGLYLGVGVDEDGSRRADVNGYTNTTNAIIALEQRYEVAMDSIYATQDTSQVAAVNAQAWSDIPDLLAQDQIEYQNIPAYETALEQNEALLETSQNTESQLEHLLVRIQNLPNLAGYPGLTGPLDLVPVITLNGNQTVTVNEGDTYTDAGATATDHIDGNITSSIVTVNNVDTTTPGIYTITYDVTDKSGIAANQAIRIVKVLDTNGNPGNPVANYAVKNTDPSLLGSQAINAAANNTNAQANASTTNAGAGQTTTASTASQAAASAATLSGSSATSAPAAVPVRDYQKDVLAVESITDVSKLSDYEIEIKRINDTFNALSPNIHGIDDLNKEEAALDAINSETLNLTGTNGYINECIIDTTSPTSQYVKDHGPTERVMPPGELAQYIPKSLTDLLPPSLSFLPDWHYAQNSGIDLNEYAGGKKEPGDYVPGGDFIFAYDGVNMKAAANTPASTCPAGSPATMQCKTNVDGTLVTLDTAKLIKNEDVIGINQQYVKNALGGLEYISGVY